MPKSSIENHLERTAVHQANIAAKNAWGAKGPQTLFINSVVGGGSAGGGVSYVTLKTRNTISEEGASVTTGVETDLRVEGKGMFIVADSVTGRKVLTRAGDFRPDELGFLKNGGGLLLFANKLDKDGKLPKDANILSSLTPVNLANVKGEPKATTSVSISMNFNSEQKSLRGAGVLAAIKKTGINSGANTSKEDILFPEALQNAGSLSIGDRFTFTSTPPGLAKTIEYGGLAIAVAPSAISKIFNAAKVGDKFSIGAGADQVPEGAGLKIILSSNLSYTFSVASNAQASNKTFNSIQTLADAINKVGGGLKAKIDQKSGNLYIASGNPDLGFKFEDSNGGTFIEKLGLIDVPSLEQAQALPGGADLKQRFNSLYTLNQAVNSKGDDYSLKATIENGSIKITSRLATDKFKVEGTSSGIRFYNKALLGNNTQKDRASVQITAPQHGLRTGDLVNVTGLGLGVVPDGVYAAVRVDDDHFNVYLLSDAPGAGPGVGFASGLPAAAAPIDLAAGGGGGTWQKIPGQKFAPVTAPITAVGAGANALLTINPGGGLGGIAAGDVICVLNGGTFNVLAGQDVTIADGYYIVQAAVAGPPSTFTIKSVNVTAANAFPARAGNTLTYQKVGKTDNANGLNFTTPAGISTFDTAGLFTTATGVAIGESRITLNMSSHNYNIGDMIRFSGLPANYVFDTMPVNNGENYKVVATGNGTITFELNPDANGVFPGAVTALNINGTYTTIPNIATTMNVGPDFRIDNVSRLLEYFSIDESAGTTKNEVYNPEDEGKSLSGNEGFTSSEVFKYKLSLFDSFGENYNLNLLFAKLGNNEWAVEIAADKDRDTGLYDIAEAKNDGQIKSGRIKFDENGQFIPGGELDGPLSVTRKNGSAPALLTIDWKNELAKVKSGTVTQFSKNEMVDIELIQQDGRTAGNLRHVDVTPEGLIVGIFDGETRPLYQIALGLVANPNGLNPGLDQTFEITRESGELLLKYAMSGEAGKILGNILEASNIVMIKEMSGVIDAGMDMHAESRIFNAIQKNFKTFLSETQG